MNFPSKINLGSGKDFRPDYLNIDINDYWNPDIVANVSTPFLKDGKQSYKTRRFGDVEITPGIFDEIIAVDVLEHVGDLVLTMTNCLELLKVGGKFSILVPYDLSYGAWQDPTHIRAFNENSWLYYTDWFWYIGWTTHRFVTRHLEFVLNPAGIQMHQSGQTKEVILRTPRMVDSMKVQLEKITLSAQDKQTLDNFLRRKAS